MVRRLKIAQLSTPFISIPPRGYGGIELVVANLTEGLVRRGHRVTLFAPGRSKTSAELVSPFPKDLSQKEMEKLFSPLALKLFWLHSLPSLYHAVCAFERAEEFDIIHSHFHYLGLFFGSLVKTPVVHTYHGDLSSALRSPIEKMILEKYKRSFWTAISQAQKRNCQVRLNFVDVIYNGVAVEKFAWEEEGGDYLAWLGRITPKKGVKEAIEVAKRVGERLVIAGVVHKRDKEYFKKEILPLVDKRSVFFIGELDHPKKVEFLKKAKVLLYPVSWEEPFGLVMVESLACGTPVVGFAKGAVPEVVKDGESGFLVNFSEKERRGDWVVKGTGVEGLCEAVRRIGKLSNLEMRELRRNCRVHVEKNFSLKKMVEGYEKIYQKILEGKVRI